MVKNLLRISSHQKTLSVTLSFLRTYRLKFKVSKTTLNISSGRPSKIINLHLKGSSIIAFTV